MSEILSQQKGHVLTLTINRPDQLNALNKLTIESLSHALEKADLDDGIRVVIITGAGPKAFVAGADIKEFSTFNQEQGKALAADGQAKLFDKVAAMSKPVIAAVNGFALGGGLELALACHIRLLSETAKVGLPEVTLGLIPGYGGTQRLAKIAGRGKAFELITSAKMIGGQEALQCGIANSVHTADELLPAAEKLAESIARNSPSAVRAAIQAINASGGHKGFETEIELFGSLFGTSEFNEGVTAFLEKRPPEF